MKTMITSFGPFHDFGVNPSNQVMEVLRTKLAEDSALGQNVVFETLDVSWADVDRFIQRQAVQPFDVFIHLGVATGSSHMRIETTGRNAAAGRDVEDAEPTSTSILESGSDIVASLPYKGLREFVSNHPEVVLSDNAGSYLCNYIYFKSLHAHGANAQVLFIHIADNTHDATAPGIERQADLVLEIIRILRDQARSPLA